MLPPRGHCHRRLCVLCTQSLECCFCHLPWQGPLLCFGCRRLIVCWVLNSFCRSFRIGGDHMSTVSPVAIDATVHTEASVLPVRSAICQRMNDYGVMARPRIMVMSAAAVSAGFVLASPIVLSWPVLAIAIMGICCLVAASSVLNQLIEAGTDSRMNRTENRPVASGRMSRFEAAMFGIGLSLTGESCWRSL